MPGSVTSTSPEGNGEPQVIMEQGKGHDQSEQGCGEGRVIIILDLKPGVHTGMTGAVSSTSTLSSQLLFLCCLIITVFSVQTFWAPCWGSLSHPSREKTKSGVFPCLF